jgi:hypothetical protein
MNRILTIAFTASLLSTSVMGEPAPPGPGPRPGTVEAMRCLVRQDTSDPCKSMFQGSARKAAMPWLFTDSNRDFKRGALVSSSYFGRATDSNRFDAKILTNQPTREMDIFDVKFTHVEYTLYISPADGDGKIRALAIPLYGPHDPLQLGG